MLQKEIDEGKRGLRKKGLPRYYKERYFPTAKRLIKILSKLRKISLFNFFSSCDNESLDLVLKVKLMALKIWALKRAVMITLIHLIVLLALWGQKYRCRSQVEVWKGLHGYFEVH